MIVEVRVPTYKRPVLLQRALASLLSQTHRCWRCVVIDDSPNREGHSVCQAINDNRISYVPNVDNLGICRNIDLAFSMAPLPGSLFLCVLEDDNYFLPENLTRNVALMEGSRIDVLLRNQGIEQMVVHDQPGKLTERTTFDGQYLDGRLAHARLWSSFFYSTGANNSSLFWRANVGLDFSTIYYVEDPVVQERLRTLCIDRDVLVALDPLIVWRDNGDESLRAKRSGLQWRLAQIEAAMSERTIYVALNEFLINEAVYHLAFQPPSGDFTAERERVFHRVGLSVPIGARRLSRRSRWQIAFKRILVRIVSSIWPRQKKITICFKNRRLSKNQ